MKTRVSSLKKEVIIGDDQPTVLIGERINPAGKKKLAEALKAGDLEIVCREAVAQAQAGADILDLSVGTFWCGRGGPIAPRSAGSDGYRRYTSMS